MTVHLFIPCHVEHLHPEIGEAAARVLTRAGAEVAFPKGQTCCGQPPYKTGHFDQARDMARRYLDIFADCEAVVCPAGSCVHMVREGYGQIFADDATMAERAADLAARTFELSEFLVDRLGACDLGAELAGRAAYHESCQVSRALGVRSQPRALLNAVQGLELVELEHADVCCGFGGPFSVQFPEVSEELLADKMADIEATGADMVVSAEPSCLMNIRAGLAARGSAIRTLHLAQVLDSRGGTS